MDGREFLWIWNWSKRDPLSLLDSGELSIDERDSGRVIKSQKRAREFLSGRWLLHKASNEFGVILNLPNDLLTLDGGKPYLRSYPFHYNISHTYEATVIAASDRHPVGVDIEYKKRERDYLGIVENYFSQNEIEAISNLESSDEKLSRFYRIWTLKEAFLKYCGTGLANQLSQIDSEKLSAQKSSSCEFHGDRVSYRSFDIAPYHLSVFGGEKVDWVLEDIFFN